MAEIDGISEIYSLLTAGWNQTTVAATIKKIYELKEPYYNTNYVLIYKSGRTEKPHGINYNYYDVTETVSIDLRTMTSEATLLSLREEARRVINTVRRGNTNYSDIQFGENITNLSDKSIGLWREIIDVKMIKYAKGV